MGTTKFDYDSQSNETLEALIIEVEEGVKTMTQLNMPTQAELGKKRADFIREILSQRKKQTVSLEVEQPKKPLSTMSQASKLINQILTPTEKKDPAIIKSSGKLEKETKDYVFPTSTHRRRHQKLERDLQDIVKRFILLKDKEKHKAKYKVQISKALKKLLAFIEKYAHSDYKKDLLSKNLSAWIKNKSFQLNEKKIFEILDI